MEDLISLMEQMLLKLDNITDELQEISHKLDNISGIHGLDDIVSKIDEAVSDIVGDTGYNLTDIHKQLVEIDTTIFSRD